MAAGGIGSAGGGGGYVLPIASDTVLGGIKVGNGLAIDQDGVLSVSGVGVSYLRLLEDVYHNANGVLRANGNAVTSGDALIYNATNGWLAAPVTRAIACGNYNNLTPDANGLVSITNPVLELFNGWAIENISIYRNYNPPQGEGTAIATITIGTAAPVVIKAPTSGGSGGATTLGGLNDVTISSPDPGQTLVYRGGEWVNESITPGAGLYLGDLENVWLYSPQPGQALVYRNGYWVNETIQGGGSYVLPVASTSALGGIRIGYQQAGKNYPVELDGNNKAYVYVPWQSGSGGSTVQWGTPGSDYIPLSVDGATVNLLTSHQSLSGYVTIATPQTISGAKTFTSPVTLDSTSGLSVHEYAYIDLGPVRIKFENNALHITKKNPNDTINYGIYADGFVAGGGIQ